MTCLLRHRVFGMLLLLMVTGCGTVGNQVIPTTLHKNFGLQPGGLQRYGLAFMTPSTVTGQEQDKQTLALIFADAVHGHLPNVRVLALPETLGALNRAGMAGEYRKMYEDYRETGVFGRETLQKIGRVAGARYLTQLKLADFSQDMRERFSLFGLRLFQTQHANIRLYMQIWDSEEGSIAWEGIEELSYSYDSSAERPVTFRTMVEEAAHQLVIGLP